MQCELPVAIFSLFISVVMDSFFIPPSITMVMSACLHDLPFGLKTLVSKDTASLRKVQRRWGAYLHEDHLSSTAKQICSEVCWIQQLFQLFPLPDLLHCDFGCCLSEEEQ